MFVPVGTSYSENIFFFTALQIDLENIADVFFFSACLFLLGLIVLS